VSPHPTVRVLTQIADERDRQDEKWGVQNHPSLDPVLTSRDGGCTPERMAEEYEIPTASRARFMCQLAAQRGDLSWPQILVEELCEAIEAGVLRGEGPEFREELVQAAAVLVAWVECIDRGAEGTADGTQEPEGNDAPPRDC